MKEIRYYRETADGRRPWVLTLDAEQNFVSDREETADERLAAMHPHLKDMMSHGVKFTQKGNAILIESMPDAEREAMRFFSLQYPCWFEGCEELRREFVEARESKNCNRCEGTLIRSFLPRVREKIAEAYAKKADNPGTGAPS